MTIALTNLTSGLSTLSSASYGTASVSPTSNNLLLLSVISRRTTTPPSTVNGNGCTWVLQGQTTLGTSAVISLWRTMSAAPTAGVVTITFASSNNVNTILWSLAEFSGVSAASTDGAGAVLNTCVASFTTAGGTTRTIVLPAIAANDGTFGVFAGDGIVNPWTTGPGQTAIATISAAAGGTTLNTITEWQATTLSSVSAVQGSLIGPKMAAIALELVAAGGVTNNLTANINAGASMSVTLSPNKNLTCSITASATMSPTLKKNANSLLTVVINARASQTASLIQTAQLQAQIQATAVLTAVLNVAKATSPRTQSTDLYDFSGKLRMSKNQKRLIRSFANSSSPKVFQNVDVTTVPSQFVPDLNARFVLIQPTNTSPYRMQQTTADLGIGLSGFSMLAVGESLSQFSLVTTVPNTTIGVSLGYL